MIDGKNVLMYDRCYINPNQASTRQRQKDTKKALVHFHPAPISRILSIHLIKQKKLKISKFDLLVTPQIGRKWRSESANIPVKVFESSSELSTVSHGFARVTMEINSSSVSSMNTNSMPVQN